MGKKSQARPGHDGVAPGAVKRATRKDRRVAAKKTKAQKKRLAPGKKGKQQAVEPQVTELQKLREERASSAAAREARRKQLQEKGVLFKAEEAVQKEHPQPPYRWNISVRKMVLYCEVTLHNVPTKHINCNMEKDKMRVDTLGHSKKYVLETAYPHGIKVDPDGLAETNAHGILSIKLKITHLPDSVKEMEEKKQKSIAEVRALRFRRNEAGELVAGKRRKLEEELLAKQKQARRPRDDDADGSDAEEGKAQAGGEGGGQKKKKKKVFVTDKDKALALIESIKEQEEPKRQQRKTMQDHAQDMKEERKARRAEKRAKKQSMEETAVKSLKKSQAKKQEKERKAALDAVKPLKKPTGRKVRFSSAK